MKAADFDWLMIVVAIVSVLVWARYLAIYRYLIPLEVMAPILVISIFRRIAALVAVSRLRGELQKRVLPLFFAAVCIVAATAGSISLPTLM